MENQSSQNQVSKEKKHTQHHGAHSGSRSGLSDYNDGGNISHYGGNEDSYNFENQQAFEASEEENEEVGKIAYGNDKEAEEENEEDYGKYHSGL